MARTPPIAGLLPQGDRGDRNKQKRTVLNHTVSTLWSGVMFDNWTLKKRLTLTFPPS